MTHKLEVLSKIAQCFNDNNITWAIGASALLYFKGIVDKFNDIDIIVDEKDTEKVVSILETFAKKKIREKTEQYSTKSFIEYTIEKVDIDIIAGFTINHNNVSHYFPLKQQHISWYNNNNTLLPLHSLEEWRTYYKLMCREEKALLIDKYLNNYINL